MTDLITQPGYITEFTDRGAKGRYVDGENVRFRNFLPQKIGGCQKLTNDMFLGVCRKLMDFKSSNLDKYIAFATNIRFYITDGGSFINVTPIRDTGTLNNPFTTTAGSKIITVADNSNGVVAGDIVLYSGATASPTDGITVVGEYEVLTAATNSYTIQHATTATNSEAGFGGASVAYTYEINTGYADSLVGTGWGGGAWNSGTWNTPRTGSGINLPLRTVSIDKWGEDVVWNIRGKQIYIFDTSGGISSSNRATLISQAPSTAQMILVSPEDRHLIAFGAHNGSSDDPMLVAWCSQEDYTDWVPTALNTAGDKRLDIGSRIVSAVLARSQILILTNLAAYSMVFVGYPEVYSIKFKASNCGSIAPNAAIAHGDDVYWMGDADIWMYDGAPSIIPCDIRNYIYDNLDRMQADKISASLVTKYREIWWLCPHKDGGYFWVTYNYEEKYFWYSSFDNWQTPRSAMIDQGEYSSNPISAGLDGCLWVQEIGVDHGSSPLPTRLKRFYDEIGGGEDVAFSSRVIPDFRSISGGVNLTAYGREYPAPNDDTDATPDTTKGPYLFTSSTRKRNIRIRARQISWVISSDNLGDYWEFGTMRADVAPLGKKG